MPMYEFTLHGMHGEIATQVQEMTDEPELFTMGIASVGIPVILSGAPDE